jgi:hypothetical protein
MAAARGEGEREVLELVRRNRWLNGSFDFEEGDPLAGLENAECFEKVVPVGDPHSLWRMLETRQGLFRYGNLYFANHASYGCFVYIVKERAAEFEHITFSDEGRFREWLERVERADGEAGTVDEFLEKYFEGDR